MPLKVEEEFEVEIDLDEGKILPTKPTRKVRKSRLAETSPDRTFIDYNLNAISQYIESRIGNGCKKATGLSKSELKEFMRTKIMEV